MLSPRQIFEDNIRPAELMLRVYRLLEHDTPKTDGEMVQALRVLVKGDVDEGLMVIYTEIFLGLIREGAQIAPISIRRSALRNLLRQAVVTACTALETYLPVLLRAELEVVIRAKGRDFVPRDKEVAEHGVLFSPNDLANRLYPPQRVLDEVLALINSEELAGIWTEDETIGWVYQYFTPKELRDQARKQSQAPRNSYELAFRNQFFTPRYVVEFLTDNTLGRTWYEMRQGETKLVEQCRYMVRRPNEVFLREGESAP
jgi:hypothetical protein